MPRRRESFVFYRIRIPLINHTSRIAGHQMQNTVRYSGHHRGHTLSAHTSYRSKFMRYSITFTGYKFHLGQNKMFSKKILQLMHQASKHRHPEFVTQRGLKNDLSDTHRLSCSHPFNASTQLHMQRAIGKLLSP